mgnify:CR=1 FL=1
MRATAAHGWDSAGRFVPDHLVQGRGLLQRALAREVLFPPQWYLLWPALRPVQLITIGLLPPGIREAYGFRWHARDARAFIRWTTAIRRVHAVLPSIVSACRGMTQQQVEDRTALTLRKYKTLNGDAARSPCTNTCSYRWRGRSSSSFSSPSISSGMRTGTICWTTL